MSDVRQFRVLSKNILCKDIIARSQIQSILRKFANIVNVVTDFGADNSGITDCTENLKKAFLRKDSFIYFPAGNYLISDSIPILDNTYVYGYRALIQNKDSNNMFINASDGTKGEYTANSNITIDGLRFRCLNDTQTIIAFSHCSDIKILNCFFNSNLANIGTQNWHLVEINSCNRVLINNCVFSGYCIFKTEMLQLDVATSSQVFPWFGPYDNTPCKNIEISKCFFRHTDAYQHDVIDSTDIAIGNHNGSDSAPIEYVNINHCFFENMKTAFKFKYLRESIIDSNNIVNALNGFSYYGGQVIKTCTISNNIMHGNREIFQEKLSNELIGRGIAIANSIGNNLCFNNIITNNIVDSFASHGIAVNGAYNDIFGNTVRACGGSGLYADYDSYFSMYHDNICNNNAVFKIDGSTNKYDILVSHYQSDNITVQGSNLIYDNICGSLGVYSYKTNDNPTRVYSNTYETINYPSSARLVNVYNNTQRKGNENIVDITNTISESQTAPNTWKNLINFTANHTAYYLVTLQVTITDNFTGSFHVRLSKGNSILARTLITSDTTNAGANLTIATKLEKNSIINGDCFFVNTGGKTGNVNMKVIELPIALEYSE